MSACEPADGGGCLKLRQRVQTACRCWQFLLSDRFTGARSPACLSAAIALPSNPVRPPFRSRRLATSLTLADVPRDVLVSGHRLSRDRDCRREFGGVRPATPPSLDRGERKVACSRDPGLRAMRPAGPRPWLPVTGGGLCEASDAASAAHCSREDPPPPQIAGKRTLCGHARRPTEAIRSARGQQSAAPK